MKVLLIDDNEEQVKGIRDFCEEKGWEAIIKDFDDSYKEIMSFDPDIIILDWCKTIGDDSGDSVLNSIWKNGFRPVVIFSGNIGTFTLDSKFINSGMVVEYEKGDEEPVIQFLEKKELFISMLSEYRDRLSNALIDGVEAISKISSGETELSKDLIQYLLSKRTVGHFDCTANEDLPPWAMYIVPPISDTLCVCDIIRKIGEDTDWNKEGSAEEYRMILTPSCDLVNTNGRKPKVEKVICAPCYSKKEFFQKSPLCTATQNVKADKKSVVMLKAIASALNQGYAGNWVALPQMMGVCPYMAADVKRVEQIDFEKIALDKNELEGKEYLRVASIDDPFANQIVWAYMQTMCRPGVPDRAVESWAKVIYE